MIGCVLVTSCLLWSLMDLTLKLEIVAQCLVESQMAREDTVRKSVVTVFYLFIFFAGIKS